MIDIVDRLGFDAVRCETQFSKGVAGNITEAAKEIERLRREVTRLEASIAMWRKHAYEVGLKLPDSNGDRAND